MPEDNFNFSDASAAALSHLQQSEAPVADPAPVEGQPVTDDIKDPTPSPEAPLDAKQLFKVKDQGKEVEVTLEDLLSGHLRHRDYTRKTMELAEQRKQIETMAQAAQQREAKVNSFLRDAEQVARYYTFLTGQQVTPQQAANMIQQQQGQPQVDVSQIRQELQQELKGIAQQTQQELAKVQEAQRAREAVEMDRELTTHIKGILADDKFKVLEDLGDFDEVAEFLCAQAARLGPVKTLDDAKAAILQIAQAKAERLGDRRKEMLKATAVSQEKLRTKSIEPPGGKGITPSPTSFKLGSKDLTKAATEWLEASRKK